MPAGGKRPGAGRPRLKIKGTGMPKATAEEILASVPEADYWRDLITAEVQMVIGKGENKQVITIVDKRLRMEALKYLTDKRDGKAPQAVTITESQEPLDFGSLPTPAITEDTGGAGKPN